MKQSILECRAIKKYFSLGKQNELVKAADGVSLKITEGETLGLVGESGCGKTTVSRLLLLLEQPTAGSIFFNDKDIKDFTRQELDAFRRAVQPVFQNPNSSLDPRMRVKAILAEPLNRNRQLDRHAIDEKIKSALIKVGLSVDDLNKFPHEFSGGQRQRTAIARAIACDPKIIILDEAISSQDISIQAQILNLLKDLQEELGIGYLFVSHDLATVRFLCDRISVMYSGRVVEHAESEAIYENPLHPYTKALLASCLPDDPDQEMAEVDLHDDMAESDLSSSGCQFAARCLQAKPECLELDPTLKEARPGHWVACFLYQ